MAKDVPVAMVRASPRQENTQREAKNLKEEIRREKANVQKMREEYTTWQADLRHREEQANSTANIRKVTRLLQYCAKVVQTKFMEIRPLFSRLFFEK